MQNLVIIGVIVVAALGGFWFLSNSDSSVPSEIDTAADMADVAMDTSEPDTIESEPMSDTMEDEDMMEEEMAEPDIVEAAISTPNLSTLVTAVSEAELVATLQGEGPFTVFAPTNAAFEALPAGTLDTLLQPANQADLQSILTYHVVPGEVMAADLTDGMTVETVNGEMITINLDDAGVTINGSATVTTPDIATSNGVVHIIDGVLLPESAQ